MQSPIRTNSSLRLLLLSAIAALALSATAAQADQLSAPLTGVIDDGGAFEGTFRVNRFRSTRLGVVASGLLIGTVTNSDGDVTDVISNRVTVPVLDIRAVGSNCNILMFEMDPIDLALSDFTVQTDPFDMRLRRDSVSVIGSQFCAIADGFDTGRFTQIVSSLNNVLDALDDR